MACSNCFNGCVETTSDQCVKYTGLNISTLEISNGDTLSAVIEQITTYLISAMSGAGIIPTITQGDLCALVSGYLPQQGDITLNDVISALFQSACDLQTQVDALDASITTIEAEYTSLACLTDGTSPSGTHDVLQAVIDKICLINAEIASIGNSLSTYVPISEIDSYIAAYLSSQSTDTRMYTKMVPYVAYPYFGSIGVNFSADGAGFGDWIKVNLCNGNNGTPDLRGYEIVGATAGMGGGQLETKVTGATYSMGSSYGEMAVTLTTAEMPAHAHTTTSTITPADHSHDLTLSENETATEIATNPAATSNRFIDVSTSSSAISTTSLSVSVNVHTTGDGNAHNNIPPVKAAYYIMYIP